MVKQLPGSDDSEETKMLTRNIDDLVTQHADTIQQVALRQTAVDDRLQRWTLFNDDYQRLVAALSALQTRLNATNTLAAEDAIATIENVSVWVGLRVNRNRKQEAQLKQGLSDRTAP